MTSNNKKLTGSKLNKLLAEELVTMRKFAYSLTGSIEEAPQ